MKKFKQAEMITGYDTKPIKSEHKIWIKHIYEDGKIYYSEHLCFNTDFYTRMMKLEFSKKAR
jgi:hypothetical protein